MNYDPELSHNNVSLFHSSNLDGKTFKQYIKDYKEDHDIKGRFNIDTNDPRNSTKVLGQFVISGTSDFFASFNSREEINQYFTNACLFILKEPEYANIEPLDITIHYDEKGLPHCHLSYLPIYENDKGEKQFALSKIQKGKEYFRDLQDRYYSHMKEKYPDKELVRINPNRDHTKHLEVKEYKEYKDLQYENRERLEKELEKKELIDKIEDKQNNLLDYYKQVNDYCRDNSITFYQYSNQCFFADRGAGSYPEPEFSNPARDLEHSHDLSHNLDHTR